MAWDWRANHWEKYSSEICKLRSQLKLTNLKMLSFSIHYSPLFLAKTEHETISTTLWWSLQIFKIQLFSLLGSFRKNHLANFTKSNVKQIIALNFLPSPKIIIKICCFTLVEKFSLVLLNFIVLWRCYIRNYTPSHRFKSSD